MTTYPNMIVCRRLSAAVCGASDFKVATEVAVTLLPSQVLGEAVGAGDLGAGLEGDAETDVVDSVGTALDDLLLNGAGRDLRMLRSCPLRESGRLREGDASSEVEFGARAEAAGG